MKNYIVMGILLLFLLYMIIWTCKFHLYKRRQKKAKRMKALRDKGKRIKRRTRDVTKAYWYNLREVADCQTDEEFEQYYHYFVSLEQGVHELLMEMYDCGIVRMDELEQIAYGENHLEKVDLSFLDEIEREMQEEETAAGEEDEIIQIEGVMADFFSDQEDIVSAARNLPEDDPGIMDLSGTLSDGMENVIAAVEAENAERGRGDEPIFVKEEKSVEEARKARELTANPEIRNQIYERWVSYVFELYEMVSINANEDTKHRIRKALMDYGYNDVDVLLNDPAY